MTRLYFFFSCCDVRCNFRVKTIFSSSLTLFVGIHVLFMFWSFSGFTTGVTSGAGTVNPSGTPLVFIGVRVAQFSVDCFVDNVLSFCSYSFCHCIVCPSI